MAEPFCPEMRKLAVGAAKSIKVPVHDGGTQVCIEGPRFSSRAESLFFKDVLKAHTINMTVVPECILAREAEICYVSIATVTDYDAWGESTVTGSDIVATIKSNVKNSKLIIERILASLPKDRKS